MQLNELFVSHKQVEPVKFQSIQKPSWTDNLYTNLERAQKVTAGESEESPVETKEETPMNWKVADVESDRLINYIKEKEGFRDKAYKDSGGVATIGYGFTDPTLVSKGSITEKDATDFLRRDLTNRATKLRSQITTWDKLNQNQRDALTSYAYNVGVENWAKYQPKLLKALNESRFNEAAQYMDAVSDKSGNVLEGLIRRRKEEQDWFNS